MMKALLATMKSQKGQGMVEYGLIIGLVAVVVIVALGLMSGSIQDIFGKITTALGGTTP
ncbi:MAG: Flp family type IVb pilin [Clostridia bacterium]|nr:Flp family type IVb pilin [Clostridia bacterium]